MLVMTRAVNTGARPQGRPRSERAKRAILKAAGELLDSNGFAGVTAEAIAAQAGVSKATIYRWWPNKAAVITDSFLELTAPEIDFVETGSVREDLRLQMRSLIRTFAGKSGQTIAALIAEGQSDPEVADAFRSRWISARREETERVLRRGVASGELCDGLDLEAVMDALYGPIYYRLLVGHLPLEERFADVLTDYVIYGLAAPGDSRGRSRS